MPRCRAAVVAWRAAAALARWCRAGRRAVRRGPDGGLVRAYTRAGEGITCDITECFTRDGE